MSAERVPLPAVLLEIARRTGAEVRGLAQARGVVSADLTDVGLEDGLQRLLAHQDYALEDLTGKNGAHRLRVVILGQHGEDAPGSASASGSQGRDILKAKLGRADEESLRNALQDPDPEVRAAVLQALAEEDAETPPPAPPDAAQNKSPEESKLRELQRLVTNDKADPQTIQAALTDALRDDDPRVRLFAVQTLATQGGTDQMQALRQAFRDLDPSMKMLVLEMTAEKDGGRPILEDAAADPDESIRSAAAELLKELSSQDGSNEDGN